MNAQLFQDAIELYHMNGNNAGVILTARMARKDLEGTEAEQFQAWLRDFEAKAYDNEPELPEN